MSRMVKGRVPFSGSKSQEDVNRQASLSGEDQDSGQKTATWWRCGFLLCPHFLWDSDNSLPFYLQCTAEYNIHG